MGAHRPAYSVTHPSHRVPRQTPACSETALATVTLERAWSRASPLSSARIAARARGNVDCTPLLRYRGRGPDIGACDTRFERFCGLGPPGPGQAPTGPASADSTRQTPSGSG